MRAAVYIRHELLRHNSIREKTLSLKHFNCPQYIIDCGFYYEPNSDRIYCFSCNFNLSYSANYIKLHQLHFMWSPNCSYLHGKDVTIRTPKVLSNLECVGWPTVANLSSPNAPLNSSFDENLGEIMPSPCDKTRKIELKSFYAITRIPRVDTDFFVLDIERFYKVMRSYKRRLETFKIEGYRFPYSDKYAEDLAQSGMIYTLFNGAVQCVFCRKVFNGIHNEVDIEIFHRWNSPKCEFLQQRYVSEFKVYIPNGHVSTPNAFDATCLICLTEVRQIFSYPCMHLTHCINCFNRRKEEKCIVCRQPGVKYHKLFV